MYEPYPVGEQMPERPHPPSSVLTAVKLMYVGAGLETLNLILNLANLSQGTITQAFAPIVGIALWIWMAQTNKAGKSWARITSTVFFGLDCVLLLLLIVGLGALSSSSSLGAGTALVAVALVSAVIIWLVGLAAIVLLWRKESSAYFAAMNGG